MWFRKRNRRQANPPPAVSAAVSALANVNRKRLAWVIGSVMAALVLTWSIAALLDRPVRRVEVMGQFHRVTPLQVEQAVMAYGRARADEAHGFVSLDLSDLKQVVEGIPWVDRVRIERRWPDGVRVAITEQIPGARWGARGLLNSRGELFLKEARYMPPELPQLVGPDGTEGEVARLYLDTFPRLASVGLRLAQVTLDARGAWELVVTSAQGTTNSNAGIAIRLGRQDVAERLDRFLTAASPLIAARPGDMIYVDMRYSNGFAIGWAKSAAVAGRDDHKHSKGAT
jgi:cell division protein FtsQ